VRFQSDRPMTSVEKVREVGEWLAEQPTDGEMGPYVALFGMAAPFIGDALPKDPCELDAQLEALVEFVGSLRSDPESETPCNEQAAAAAAAALDQTAPLEQLPSGSTS
jgi:hypothetical protein